MKNFYQKKAASIFMQCKKILLTISILLLTTNVFAATIDWIGATNTDWNTASNWSSNTVPTSSDYVNIQGGAVAPVLSTVTTIINLQIFNGYSLTIAATGRLNIIGDGGNVAGLYLDGGNVINNGMIVLEALNGTTLNYTELNLRPSGNLSTLVNNGYIKVNSTSFAIAIGTNSNANINSITNNSCGVIYTTGGGYFTNLSLLNNAGLIICKNSFNQSGTFANNGIINYQNLTGSFINNTNPAVIVNNSMPIFTYGGTFNGTVNGIYKDSACTISAGTYTAPNTFVPNAAILPLGSQTLYAKITPNGGACNYIVPFTYVNICVPITSSFNITQCAGTSYLWNGINQTTNGAYLDTFLSINGCDSIATANLNFTPNLTIAYVDSAVAISGNGSSWATAFKTVQEGINACGVQQIWVRKGTYYPTLDTNGLIPSNPRYKTFKIKNNVAVYGGFAGTETVLNQRILGTNTSILCGDIGVANDSTDNAYHVVYSAYHSNTTIIDGFDITGGNANDASYTGAYNDRKNDGGGMQTFNSKIIINHINFYNNTAQHDGGALANMFGYNVCPTVSNCFFYNNYAGHYGGGMVNNRSHANIINCVFAKNTANVNGGGIDNSECNPIITNCTFGANRANVMGGAISNCTASSSPIITNCILYGDSAGMGMDAEIHNESVYNVPVITYCTIAGGYVGSNNSSVNPLFFNTANAKGADGIFKSKDDGLNVQIGSSAIDSGNNAAVPIAILTDITGAARIINTSVNKGAYEVFPCTPNANIIFDTICANATRVFNGVTIAVAGAYLDTLINTSGCDSFLTLELYVSNAVSSTTTLSNCNAITWSTQSISASGTYTASFTNVAGCDSIATLNFIRKTASYSTTTLSNCNTISWNTQNITASGTYTAIFTNAIGCDSVITLNFTKLASPIITPVNNFTICNNESLPTILFNTNISNAQVSWTNNNTNIGLAASGTDSILTFKASNNSTSPITATITATAILPNSIISALPNWQKSFVINVTENSGTTLNGYQLKMIINTQQLISSGWLNADGSDLRFGNINGNTLYNYWIESGLNTTNTIVWVKIDQLLANTTTNIFMFCGNTAASAVSNINGTFNGPNSSTDSVASGIVGGVGNSQRGFKFAPNEDLLVTSFGKREPTGSNRYITLFDFATQAIINQTQVAGPAGQYSYTNINAPLWLISGTDYLLEMYQAAGDGYYFGSSNQIGQHLTYKNMYYCNSCTQNTFPASVLANYQYGYPDLWYYTKQNVAQAPTYTINLILTCTSTPSTFNITVNPSIANTIYDTICSNANYTFNGNILNTSGTYLDTFAATNSCDSLVTLNLFVKITSSFTTTFSDCNAITWNTQNISASGTYTAMFTNAVACDSVATLIFTRKVATSFTTTFSDCNAITWNTQNISASGTYTASFINAAGCDSIATLNFTKLNATSGAEIVSNCTAIIWHTQSISASGTYTASFTNAAGCDSIATLNFTKLNATSGTEVVSNCTAITWHTQSISASGTYTASFINAAGCDSIATLNFTKLNTAPGATDTIAACINALPYYWNGNLYDSAGVYTDTFANAGGCDSIATLLFSVLPTSTNTDSISVCTNILPYYWFGYNINTQGLYSVVFTNTVGCDSIAKIYVSIYTIDSSTTNMALCINALPYNWLGNICSAAGTYIDTFPNAKGCDSITILQLSIKDTTASNTVLSLCASSLPYLWNGLSINASGTYQYTTTNTVGCDSLAYLQFTIDAISVSNTIVNICNANLPYIWNTNSYATAGTYTDTFISSTNCDSVAILQLNVLQATSSITNKTVCIENLPYTWNGNTYSAAGTYTVAFGNTFGCDSTATLQLSITDLVVSTINYNVRCASQNDGAIKILPSNGTAPYNYSFAGLNGLIAAGDSLYNLPTGTYSLYVTDANGCADSSFATITKPDSFYADVIVSAPNCAGNISINTYAQAHGGTLPYSYLWFDVNNTNLTNTSSLSAGINDADTIYSLPVGCFKMFVTDANGCYLIPVLDPYIYFCVAQPDSLQLHINADSVICNGTTTNAVAVTTGGTGFITITPLITNLSAGNYTFTATDANGCSTSNSISILLADSTIVAANATSTNICAGNIVTLSGSINNASGTAFYNWTNSTSNAQPQDNIPFVLHRTTTFTVSLVGSNCIIADTITIVVDSNTDLSQATIANANSMPGTNCSNTIYAADGLQINYTDNNCSLIATVQDSMGNNILGNVQACVSVDSNVQSWNLQPYAARTFTITVTNQGDADVTLYYTNDDIADYNNYMINSNSAFPQMNAPNATPQNGDEITNASITKLDGGGLGVGIVNAVIPVTLIYNDTTSRWSTTFHIDSFSSFYLHATNPNNAPLSIGLLSFTGNKNNEQDELQWITNTENNNAYFTVQHSADGNNFTTITTVKTKAPNGTSNGALPYTAIHNKPIVGKNYYQLLATDMNGAVTKSKMIRLDRSQTSGTMIVYPNPTKGELHIEVTCVRSTNATIKIMDVTGKLVKQIELELNQGITANTIDVGDIANGVYLIKLSNGKELNFSTQFRKQ
jgi:Secretion system C-terminal sorting domain/Domain of unknown function (DUF2341)